MPRRPKSKSCLVIGLGHFGQSVARTLAAMGHDVVAVDNDPAAVEAVCEEVTHAVQLDGTDAESLRELDIPSFDRCVIGRGTSLEDSINMTMGLRELGAKFIVAKAMTDRQASILEKLGADHVVFPERDMGIRVAHSLQSPRIMDYMDLGRDLGIEEILAPAFIRGKTLRELELRQRYGINVIAVRRGADLKIDLAPDETLQEGDILIIAGSAAHLEAFSEGEG